MRICTLASSSSGNSCLVECGGTRLLIDAGLSRRRIKTALSELDLKLEDIDGILVTHCHIDHIKGLKMLIKYDEHPIFTSSQAALALCGELPEASPLIERFEQGQPFSIGNIKVLAFPTSHDSPGSSGFRLEGDGRALAFATDLGTVTDEVLDGVLGADAAVVEANHDLTLLRHGPYPWPLKKRILSEHGHLSNDDCGRLCAQLCRSGTRSFVLAHLSKENNTPSCALAAVSGALRDEGLEAEVTVAPGDWPGDIIEV